MRFEFSLILIGPKRTKRITGNAFGISFSSDWQKIVNGFFSRLIKTRTQILVGRWGPKKWISASFRRRASPELIFVCGAG